MAPEDSKLVASIDSKDNGITRINLVDTLHCETADMTCNGYAASYAEYLNKATGRSGYEVVQSSGGLGYSICRNGEKTGFDLVFLDGDNAMVSGDKPFCLVGVTGKADAGQKACLEYGAALIWTAYPDLRKAEAKELALILYSKDSPIHARNGSFELYCQVNQGYSLTILNGDRYND